MAFEITGVVFLVIICAFYLVWLYDTNKSFKKKKELLKYKLDQEKSLNQALNSLIQFQNEKIVQMLFGGDRQIDDFLAMDIKEFSNKILFTSKDFREALKPYLLEGQQYEKLAILENG